MESGGICFLSDYELLFPIITAFSKEVTKHNWPIRPENSVQVII